MRWLQLYLRARRVPMALVTAVAMVGLVWALWWGFAESRTVNARLVLLAVMLAVAAFVPTLSGADDALDHTAAVNWPVRRAGHLLFVGVVVLALLLGPTVTDARYESLSVVLRNTAGLVGLAALGAALLGVARAWIAPLVWTLVALLMGPSTKLTLQVAAWLIQPAGTTAATACATTMAVAGTIAYTLFGCPRRPAVETTPDH